MSGSSGSGDDIEAGRINFAESTTVVQGGRPSELDVSFNGLAAFEAGPRRDGQRPDWTLTGVLGRGWNGSNSPLSREPGAGVIGIGAPNRGPGLVGLGGGTLISQPILGSQGNLGSDGLGGTGVIGLGGPGSPSNVSSGAGVAFDAPSLPGVGLVGEGGEAFFGFPVSDNPPPGVGNGAGVVGIAGGRNRAPSAPLSQSDLAATANVGVVGFGGDGPKRVGSSDTFIGPRSAGAGVRGVGGVAVTPGDDPITTYGPGVVGVAGDAETPADETLAGVGTAGIASSGYGVLGRSVGFPGIQGRSSYAAGVAGDSDKGVGVAGFSSESNGGYFATKRLAQVHLDPLPSDTGSPQGTIPGRAGDLLALEFTLERGIVSLWFCKISGDATTAQWVRLD